MTDALPIIIPTPLIPAVLDGRKTQHRVPMDPQPKWSWAPHQSEGMEHTWVWRDSADRWKGAVDLNDCPWGWPGQRLWVREIFWDAFKRTKANNGCIYRADYGHRLDLTEAQAEGLAWRPPSKMPRWASRITLEVIDVQVQRIQDITEEDAKAEGTPRLITAFVPHSIDLVSGGIQACGPMEENYVGGLGLVWDPANPSHPWSTNPWVWAITFKRAS